MPSHTASVRLDIIDTSSLPAQITVGQAHTHPLASALCATPVIKQSTPAETSAANEAMRPKAGATALNGWINGLLGMLIFSGSLPATRVALAGFSPSFLTFSRASLAGLLALLALALTRSRRPIGMQWAGLTAVALGAVVGFPLFTGMALQWISSAQALVFIGLMPLSTALFGVLRTSERLSRWFWLYSVLGAGCIVAYALYQLAAGATAPLAQAGSTLSVVMPHHAVLLGEVMMLLAVLVCGYAYAEGAHLARSLGGWQVICWALTLALPVMLLAGWIDRPWESDTVLAGLGFAEAHHVPTQASPTSPFAAWFALVPPSAWFGLAYVSLFSMLIGFFFWYRGLAIGGIAAVGQLQLLQPFVGLLLAALVLGETIQPSMLWVSAAVVACVAMARRAAAASKPA